MRQRLFNRLAQRYLVRDNAPLPLVGSPGPDLAKSADWYLEEARVDGTFELFTAADQRQSLTIVDGTLALREGSPTAEDSGSWALHPSGDSTGYQFVVSANDPSLALAVADAEPSGAGLALVLSPARDRGSMWLLQNECVADARSVHLRYQAPNGVLLFYNEVYPEQVPPGTFFCTSGFGANAASSDPSGYAGIQRRIDGSRQAIFSVWHRMADGERPVDGALATVVAAHPNAYVTAFSGEGSGSSVRIPLDWRDADDHRVRVCLVAEPLGSDTVLTSYMALGEKQWVSLGAIVRAETSGALMNRPYAFIEDFARTGNAEGVAAANRSPYRLRSARFVNPWFVGVSKRLQPVTQASVTAYSPHLLENLTAEAASVGGFGMRMTTGARSAPSEPPIGASFEDSAPAKRSQPELSGVPYLAV